MQMFQKGENLNETKVVVHKKMQIETKRKQALEKDEDLNETKAKV